MSRKTPSNIPLIRKKGICMSTNAQIEFSKEIGPNWFASVMGTGIIANAAVGLPWFGEHLSSLGLAIWLLASIMLFLCY